MIILNLMINSILIFNVSGYVLNYEDEDRIFDILLNDYYVPVEAIEGDGMSTGKEQNPIFYNGVWLCGNCSDINETKLIYNESYDMEISYDQDMELQIGFSMDNMRCIKINTDEDGEVERASGACASDDVTLKVMNTNRCDVWIYS